MPDFEDQNFTNETSKSIHLIIGNVKTTTPDWGPSTSLSWDELPVNDSNNDSIAFCKQILLEEINGHRFREK